MRVTVEHDQIADAAGPARAKRKERVGRVVRDRMEKTVVVAVERLVRHRLYGRVIRRTKRLHAHDEEGRARLGDLVRVIETRPLSATKRWRVVEVVEKAR